MIIIKLDEENGNAEIDVSVKELDPDKLLLMICSFIPKSLGLSVFELISRVLGSDTEDGTEARKKSLNIIGNKFIETLISESNKFEEIKEQKKYTLEESFKKFKGEGRE